MVQKTCNSFMFFFLIANGNTRATDFEDLSPLGTFFGLAKGPKVLELGRLNFLTLWFSLFSVFLN